MDNPKTKKATKPPKLKFKYVIPDNLGDLYVTGAYGGIGPRYDIHMHLFNERAPIPEETTLEFSPEDGLGKEIKVVRGGDVIRLIQASVIMNVDVAEDIRDWLDDRIKIIRELEEKNREEMDKKASKKG